MSDGKTSTFKRSSKGLLKRLLMTLRKPPSPSTPPEPPALRQENPGEEIHSVSHAIGVSGAQSVNSGISASVVTSRQGNSRVSFPRQNPSFQYADHCASTPISRLQRSSSGAGPSFSAVVQGEQTSEHMQFTRLTDVCRSAQNHNSGWR